MRSSRFHWPVCCPSSKNVVGYLVAGKMLVLVESVRKMDIFTLIFATISLNFLLTLFFLNFPPSKALELSLFTWHDTWTLYHRNGRTLCSLASSIIREVDGRTPLVILPAMPSVAAGQPVVDRLPTTWGLP